MDMNKLLKERFISSQLWEKADIEGDINIILRNALKISTHRATKIMKNWAIVENSELLDLSDLVEIPAIELIEKYGVGKSSVTDTEKLFHKRYLALSKKVDKAEMAEAA